ncbi:NACHT domain-containing protein [Leeia oryzae]|uniref:NACHT domain-containing protein n=1 Tax=Leeia oryzae TaxID=356662 RepID=UPI0012EA9A49|nr:hypothetical protein [Leeia oryzae]
MMDIQTLMADQAASVISAQLIKKPIESVIDFLSGKIKDFTKIILPNEIPEINARIDEAGKVRTISSQSKVNLKEVYYPAKIIVNKKRLVIDSVSELEEYSSRKRIALTGVAGQGKSFLIKYLWLNEFDDPKCMPLFLNLRDIKEEVGLFSLVKQGLAFMGVRVVDEDFFKELMASGYVKLFLDGLDEVSLDVFHELLRDISILAVEYPKVTILVTSRPGVLLERLSSIPDFTSFEIAKLEPKDYLGFLNKIGTDDGVANKLISSLNSNANNKVRTVVDTPLMLTLLVNVYGCHQKIPDNIPDFYRQMLHVLSYMHDSLKPGFVRKWATSLTPEEINTLFETFCYASMECASNSLDLDKFSDAFNKAKSISGINCTLPGFRTDVVDALCLMVKDGIYLTFIHTSIQEFFCAFFISHSKNEDFVMRFYQSFDSLDRFAKFDQVLRFLESIDSERYYKYYISYWFDRLSEEFNLDDPDNVFDGFIAKDFLNIHKKIDNPLKFKMLVAVLAYAKHVENNGVYSYEFDKKLSVRYIQDYINELNASIKENARLNGKRNMALLEMLNGGGRDR